MSFLSFRRAAKTSRAGTARGSGPTTSLHFVLGAMTWGVGLLAMIACVLLIVLTTRLHQHSIKLATALENVQLAQRVELLLLMRHGSPDPVARAEEGGLSLATADELARTAQTPEAMRLVERLHGAVGRYLGEDVGPESGTNARAREAFDEAFTASRRLVEVNLTIARETKVEVVRTDETANLLGVAVATALALGIAGTLVWLRRRVFTPGIELGAAMHRFAAGNLEARAPVEGATEVRAMAETFNELALALVRTRQDQLRYVASVVHDLRNPLAAVQLAAGFVSPDRPLPSEHRLRQIFDIVRRQLSILNSMVSDVLNTATIEAGELTLRCEDHDVRELMNECVSLFAMMSPAHVIKTSLPDSPVVVHCDRIRVQQVLNNLLSNAIKYSPLGTTIHAAVRRDDGHVLLSVTDEGEGIPPESRAEIFEPFHRTPASREHAPGVGLGLYISRKMVEAHGGSLDVDSQIGLGSTFTVVLPWGAVRTALAELAADAAVGRGGRAGPPSAG